MTNLDIVPYEHTLDESHSWTSQTLSLDEAAAEITALGRKSDDLTLELALKTVALKHRLIGGEAGKSVKWMEWMRKRINLSESYLYQLIDLGEADDPSAALEEWRREGREKKKKERDEKKEKEAALSNNHKLLLKLIPKLADEEAKSEYVQLYLRYRNRLD